MANTKKREKKCKKRGKPKKRKTRGGPRLFERRDFGRSSSGEEKELDDSTRREDQAIIEQIEKRANAYSIRQWAIQTQNDCAAEERQQYRNPGETWIGLSRKITCWG